MAESLMTFKIKNKHDNDKKRNRYNYQENFILRKRPTILPQTNNDIYVNNKSNFKRLFDKCQEILKSGEPEINIHGLGAAIPEAINLSLKIQKEFFNVHELSVNTSTVYLQDEFEPINEDYTTHSQIRPNSAVHIRIFQKTPVT